MYEHLNDLPTIEFLGAIFYLKGRLLSQKDIYSVWNLVSHYVSRKIHEIQDENNKFQVFPIPSSENPSVEATHISHDRVFLQYDVYITPSNINEFNQYTHF